MILSRVRLDPFGAKTDTELTFKPGLNVILGPNEAGKSTVFSAIFAALFVRTKLRKRAFEREIAGFLPLGGGDTVRVELDCFHAGGDYRLKKSWGGTAASELSLPDGTVVTGPEAVEERLAPLLGAGEGTYRSVLMTRQASLGRTLPALREDFPGTVRDLDDLLLSAVLETDGISPDRFRERVEKEYSRYFDHWDRKEAYPEQGRGIENPWRKQVGEILQAFYRKEELKKAREEVRRLEGALEEINHRIAAGKENLRKTDDYLARNRKAAEDARERKNLEGELSGLRIRLRELEEANRDWPVVENRLEELARLVPELAGREETIARERRAAEAGEKTRALRELYSRAREKKRRLDQARIALEECPAVTRPEVEELRSAQARLGRLEAVRAAGKLSVKLTAKENAEITVREDLAEPRKERLAAGETVELTAGSRIGIDHPGLTIEAAAGDRPFPELEKEYGEAEEIRGRILEKLGLAGPAEAEAALRSREGREAEVRAARENLINELGEFSYRELEEKAGSPGPAGESRPLAEVIAAHEKLKGEIRSRREEKERLEKRAAGYADRYDDRRSLLLAAAEAAGSEKDIREKIGSLTPLPKEAGDAGSFLAEFRKREEEAGELREVIHRREIERADLSARLPEETEEALAGRAAEAEERFAAAVKAGEAIARIRELTGELLGEVDRETFTGLRKDLEGMIERLTDRRYRSVAMEGSLPRGLVRDDGRVLTSGLLSLGTRDGLALAVRLAMAGRFLEEGGGFLLLDDPLVDLDPERRRAAAGLIEEFAGSTQLLVFTCHPEHAGLLRGRQVTLEP